MKKEEKRMIESYISAYNNFNVEGMVVYLSENIIFENFSNGKLTHSCSGLVEFKKMATVGLGCFSSRSQTVVSWSQAENAIQTDIKYEGIAKIDFPNGIKRGEKLELVGSSEFPFKEAMIIKIIDKS